MRYIELNTCGFVGLKISEKTEKRIVMTIMIIWSLAMAFTLNNIINFLISFLICFVCFITQKKVKIDICDGLVLVGMIWFCLYRFQACNIDWKLAFPWGILVFFVYQMGKRIVFFRDCFQMAFVCIIILEFSMFIRGALNTFNSLERVNNVYWYWPVWYEGDILMRTDHSFYFILTASLLSYWIFTKKYYVLKLIGICMSSACIYFDIHTWGRLITFCVLGAFFTSVILMIADSIKMKKISHKGVKRILIILLVVISLVSLILIHNHQVIYEKYVNSYWSRGGGILHNARITMWKEQLNAILEEPLSSSEVDLHAYYGSIGRSSHNSWLDIGRSSGLIPMLMMLCFTVVNFINMLKMCWNYRDERKYALVAVFMGMFIMNILNSVIYSKLFWWNIEILLGGMVNGLCYKDSLNENVEKTSK